MLVVRWLLLLAAFLSVPVQSQQNTPAKVQTKAGANKSNEQIGTNKKPLVVMVQPTDEDKKEAEARTKERNDKLKSDADLVTWTQVLAWIAGFQFLALLLQAGIFLYQSGRLKQTVMEMRKEFISTHRPKITMRGGVALAQQFGTQINASCELSNTGNSRLRFVRTAFDLDFEGATGDVGGPPPFPHTPDLLIGRALAAGEPIIIEIVPTIPLVWPIPDGFQLVLTGHVIYADDSNVERRARFRRHYDPLRSRFFRRNDPENDELDYCD